MMDADSRLTRQKEILPDKSLRNTSRSTSNKTKK